MLERKWWTLITICVGIFMLLLDITIVNIALPDMARDLGASFSDLQWVVDAYALTLAALMLTAGSLGDLAGHRLVFVCGVVVFTLSSLTCGVATDPNLLIGSRVVQGIGGAAMFASSLALIGNAFHGRDRGVALGAWGATAGAAVAAGPLIGGALTSGASWRWVFLVNVPIGVFALVVTLWKVAETERKPDVQPDWVGFVSLGAALGLIVFGLIRGNAEGWSSITILGAFAAGAAVFVFFLLWESRRRHPMIELGLFRTPSVVGASVGALAISCTLFASLLYLVLYVQDVLGYSPFQAGLRFLPLSALILVSAPVSGRASEHVPPRFLIGGGLALIAVSLATMARTGASSGWTVLLPGFIIGGIGAGLVNPALASTAVGTVRREMAGVGSGLNNTFRQVGIAVGIAGLGAIFQTRVSDVFVSDLSRRAPGLAGRAHAIAHSITTGNGLQQVGSDGHAGPDQRAIGLSAHAAFVAGLDRIMWVAAAGSLVGAVVAVVLIRPRDFHGSPSQQQQSGSRTGDRSSPAEPAQAG
jgi:EmrB/QacA subfamily drug resistance transporter